jgi:hypothetical protein
MITLYHSSGAQDFQLLDEVYSESEWLNLKYDIIKLLMQGNKMTL